MPLPKLTEWRISWVIQQVATYVYNQRENFRHRASARHANQLALMRHFFPQSLLDTARVVVLRGERVGNPAFYNQLTQMGFPANMLPKFGFMSAITFVDTIVSHEAFTDKLLFHELVHVVQYEKLGLPEFAEKYVRGFLSGGSYDAIPLEMNAYALDARFAAAPAKRFSVEAEVQAWIDSGRF